MKKKLLIIGSGGHAKSCIDVIEGIKNEKIIGIIYNTKMRKYIQKMMESHFITLANCNIKYIIKH